MTSMFSRLGGMARRDFLRAGFGSLAFGAAGALTRAPAWAQTAAHAAEKGRILVVVELSGGNDGLNTVVPYGDDAYYRARPRIGIKPARLRKLDDHFGFQYTMAGLERLYKDGHVAIVHGVGYEQPSFSHFSSMAYWQTAAPNRGDLYGWVGRMADAMDPEGHANFVVNIDTQQSLAVRSQRHVPLVFDDPQKFIRTGFADEKAVLSTVATREAGANEAQEFMYGVSRSALNAEQLVRDAWANYRTPIDYGLVRFGLDRVAPAREGEYEPGHRSRHRGAGLHDRRPRRGRSIWQDAESDRTQRRQHGVHHRFPPRLCHRHQELDGLPRRRRRAARGIRAAADYCGVIGSAGRA